MAGAVRVVAALDAELAVLVARKAARAVLVAFVARVDASMCAHVATLARTASVVGHALDAVPERTNAEASRGVGAVVVAETRRADAGRDVASEASARSVVRAWAAGGGSVRACFGGVAAVCRRRETSVDGVGVEFERAVAGVAGEDEDRSDPSDDERGACSRHGSAEASASASARAKPVGRCFKYSFAAWTARARFVDARMRIRSTSAFSARGPAG